MLVSHIFLKEVNRRISNLSQHWRHDWLSKKRKEVNAWNWRKKQNKKRQSGLISQLLRLCVSLRWSIMGSYLSPQFKLNICLWPPCLRPRWSSDQIKFDHVRTWAKNTMSQHVTTLWPNARNKKKKKEKKMNNVTMYNYWYIAIVWPGLKPELCAKVFYSIDFF